jgi:hypothetical protein
MVVTHTHYTMSEIRESPEHKLNRLEAKIDQLDDKLNLIIDLLNEQKNAIDNTPARREYCYIREEDRVDYGGHY